jgi:hypothetical protein
MSRLHLNNCAVFFGNSNVQGQDVYVFERETFDQCNGHAAPRGVYHYHAQIPNECLGQAVDASAHAQLVGCMANGIPIYGPEGNNGVIPEDLDKCNGHTDIVLIIMHFTITTWHPSINIHTL